MSAAPHLFVRTDRPVSNGLRQNAADVASAAAAVASDHDDTIRMAIERCAPELARLIAIKAPFFLFAEWKEDALHAKVLPASELTTTDNGRLFADKKFVEYVTKCEWGTFVPFYVRQRRGGAFSAGLLSAHAIVGDMKGAAAMLAKITADAK